MNYTGLIEEMKRLKEELKVISDRIEALMFEIDAIVMKKTTQKSPEFHGGANRS